MLHQIGLAVLAAFIAVSANSEIGRESQQTYIANFKIEVAGMRDWRVTQIPEPIYMAADWRVTLS